MLRRRAVVHSTADFGELTRANSAHSYNGFIRDHRTASGCRGHGRHRGPYARARARAHDDPAQDAVQQRRSHTDPHPRVWGSHPRSQGSAPGNPDPHNLEGVWWLQGYEYLLGPEPGVPPPLKPAYMQILERRIRAKNRGTPEADASTQCMPHGMPRLMESPYPIEIVQTPGRITFLHEVAHNTRRIWLTRDHPKNVALTFLGDSVGHWEGDTLVVDTVGLNDRTFIDDEGSSHSTQEHVVERYRKIETAPGLSSS